MIAERELSLSSVTLSTDGNEAFCINDGMQLKFGTKGLVHRRW